MIGKRIDGPYTVIGNAAAQDAELSWKAKGLLIYLLSLPKNWNIRISELANHATDGYDSTKRAMDELLKSGYIKRGPRVRKPDGKLGDYVYLLSGVRDEMPNLEKPNMDFPSQGKPSQGKPSQENRQLQNKELTKETNNKRNTEYITHFEGWWDDWKAKATRKPGRKAKAFENFKKLLAKFSVAEIQIATKHYLAECGDSYTKDAERFLVEDLIEQHQEPSRASPSGQEDEWDRAFREAEQLQRESQCLNPSFAN
jgi:hypothetical protein